ncbi:IclR family transcriptional regulator [Thalassotalea piscium]
MTNKQLFTEKNKYAVPALDKALDVLEFLATQDSPKSQSEIATALKRSANEIYRILVNLESRGYLFRDESGKYKASLKIYNLSRRISPIDQMRQCALPHMEDLAVNTGQSCHLSMLYQSQTMVIVQARSHKAISINISEGVTFSTTSTNAGLVLLANSSDVVREMILVRDQHFNAKSDQQKKQLLSQLNDIKESGYYMAESNLYEGVYDYVALIGQPEGAVIAALAISSLKTQTNAEMNKTELINQLKQTADKITHQLSC